MAYSFTQIERNKTHIIGWVFTFLIIFYFCSFYLLGTLYKNLFLFFQSENYQPVFFLSGIESMVAFLFALVVGFLHLSFSTRSLIEKMLKVLRARKPDPDNHYHQIFINIIEEVRLASGGTSIEGIILPTTAFNAFALADFEGRAVIGVTEGLLTRFSRSQTEAVVAHEAAHIVGGDCLSVTVSSCVFEVFNSFLDGVKYTLLGMGIGEDQSTGGYGIGGRGGGGSFSSSQEKYWGGADIFSKIFGLIIFFVFVYGLMCLARLVSRLFNMVISREIKFRADAVAVQLTRDPLSLLEALYIISKHWSGSGMVWGNLQSIFIVNPNCNWLDRGEGFFSDLFSTHPPVEKRIQVLMDMAHENTEALQDALLEHGKNDKAEQEFAAPFKWFLQKDQQWIGPYSIAEIERLNWVNLQTVVKRIGGEQSTALSGDPTLRAVWNERFMDRKKELLSCPECRSELKIIDYESVSIQECSQCHGTLVNEDNLLTILNRKERVFSPGIRHLAGVLQNQSRINVTNVVLNLQDVLNCPGCQSDHGKMRRMFFNPLYPVEVDKCPKCGLIWFNQDELEVLQCLFEDKVNTER